MGKLFGTDGVRGVANQGLPPELAFRLGRAGAAVLAGKGDRVRVVVGRDTRISGDMLEAALVAGICSVGGQVLKVGIIPTPAVAWLTRDLGADAGVVISASHNPVADNGIKFFSASGYKLPDPVEEEIERLVLAPEDNLPRPVGVDLGGVKEVTEAPERYIAHVCSTAGRGLAGMQVVLDCANGAACRVAPAIFQRLGAEVSLLHNVPDGTNINVRCGSTHPESLQAEVVARGAAVGLAFDGDADRVIAVDEKGQVVDGDVIMTILALYRQEQGGLPGGQVVVTVMSNYGLHQALTAAGLRVQQTRVGDRYVLEEMLKSGAVLGGEQSGHIILLEHNTTGDGLITGVQLLQVMAATGKPLSELAAAMPRLPQILVNVRVGDKDAAMASPALQAAVAAAREQLAGRGRVLVRPSGTEPIIRLMVEGPDREELENIMAGLHRVASGL
ncbi:phosphoglucosamine mutase [Neomoorella thermoacetica]|uniref:phosphoglucosamine mutase n=1 Tax=Neomoorella thermoacetica TaxID=1525 RepID=UPI0008FB06FF|nr:phosphoglucosamine mutase [Moorella thermoacetica]OIQ53227.1 phosphoglucosamine mutase [Moorella thermoacetica]OIQ58777.1 phosphoglucosamine mutase [Moorella thermoacetica]